MIDDETIPRFINVVIDNIPAYMKELKEQANEDGHNEDLLEDEHTKLALTLDHHAFHPSEYYYDEEENSIEISGQLVGNSGESWFSISMPLSNGVLIDILQACIKKLNKLKATMEALS